MTIRVAINGFGRIGRAFMRRAQARAMDSTGSPQVEIVAVNDLGSPEGLAYLLAHDTVYGRAPFSVEVGKVRPSQEGGDILLIDGKEVRFFSEKDPAQLPWKDLDIDVVVESTGFFTSYEKAQAHLEAGAKRVVISAPAKGDGGSTVLMGVNEDDLAACRISSNASCTTNAASPLIAILDEAIGIESAILSTTHAYTASQSLVDGLSKKDVREGRAAALNIVPTSTGAATAVAAAYKPLAGKFDGISLRVPVAVGSITAVPFVAKRPTTAEEVNGALRAAAELPRWAGIFTTTNEKLVSSDIVGEPCASIADLSLTRVVGSSGELGTGTLVKVLAWYDNEMGYAETLVRHVIAAHSTSSGQAVHA